MEKEAVVKTPIELQLQKINLPNLLQYKNMQLQYHLLRVLWQIVTTQSQMVNSPVYFKLFNELLNFQEIDSIKQLPLFERFSYQLWNNEHISLEIRQKTNFYRIVSNWIINFELRSGKLDTIDTQIEFILEFMKKETKTSLERLVMMQEIVEDLKDLITPEFWQEEKQIKLQTSAGKFKNQLQPQQVSKEESCSQKEIRTIEIIFQLIQAIQSPLYYKMHQKEKLYKNCTYGNANFNNVKEFIKKAIYYVLRQKSIPTHYQTELTKIALIYLQYLTQEQSNQISNLIKHLMIKTSKAVRFALVIQYVEFYEYLEFMGFEDVIEELENIIYFRELIIGKKIVEESIMQIGNNINDLNLSYRELYIKAGLSKKVYFSNQHEDCVLKLDVLVQQNDINMKIVYFDSIVVDSTSGTLKKVVFQTIVKINDYDGSKVRAENVYWRQEKATSKKLQIKLQHQGLYCLQFDNSYSWVIPKHIKYRLELYEPLK